MVCSSYRAAHLRYNSAYQPTASVYTSVLAEHVLCACCHLLIHCIRYRAFIVQSADQRLNGQRKNQKNGRQISLQTCRHKQPAKCAQGAGPRQAMRLLGRHPHSNCCSVAAMVLLECS